MSFGKEAKSSVPRLINIWNDMRESKETHEAVEDALLAIDPVKQGNWVLQRNSKVDLIVKQDIATDWSGSPRQIPNQIPGAKLQHDPTFRHPHPRGLPGY